MNIKMIFHTLGHILKVEAILMVLPLIVSFIYSDGNYWSFIIPIIALLFSGFALTIFIKPNRKNLFAKEGFVIVGLSWIVMSLFGCLPFIISQEIPKFIDAFFETVSGLTTTGATILTDIESLSHSMLFWRSFTHWIGGMGVLVFILAIIPIAGGQNIFLLRAESTGPQVGKLVSKVKVTARILYLIYLVLTLIQICLLYLGKMPLFDAINIAFSTAGTGGFAIKNDSLASYNDYCQIVTAIFMLLFGVNFNVFYLIIIGKVIQAIKNEELWWYLGLIGVSMLVIFINLITAIEIPAGLAFKDSFFHVVSIITSTGFATTDYNAWPALAQTILFFITFVGACAGSTGGGIKVSRTVILFKTFGREIKKLTHPNSVANIRFDGNNVDESVVKGVSNYFIIYILLFVCSFLVITLDGFDFKTNITSIAACLNNTGPGIGGLAIDGQQALIDIGPLGNYSPFSFFSKLVLTFTMFVGRLEIYPILILFNPKVWLNK